MSAPATFPSVLFHPPTSRTKTIAIIGDPIEHSITPRIQNAAWQAVREAGLTADVVNVAFHVSPDRLTTAVRGAQSLGLLGLMATIPHKEAVLELCDELDESARLMGAANLLHFRADGKIVGHSSDGWAAVKSLEEEGITVSNSSIAILGGGGAARSLALTFARVGAAKIYLVNRTVARAAVIADEVAVLGTQVEALPLNESLGTVLEACNLLVNATSVGMHPHEEEIPLAPELLRPSCAVYDIVYNPLETRLLAAARQAKCRAVDGLGMLIYTNVYAAAICAGVDLSAAVMRREALVTLTKN